ncbi:MAG: hypothetical protein Q9196_004077 [Gyalolechia fulgens]
MVGPETPTRPDDGIQRITLDLSAKWGLRFPPQVRQSPAKRDRDRPDEQALSRLRWLYFHDLRNNQAATQYAIQCFERFAPKLLAGWVAKPRAEQDVLPTRTRSATARHQDFLFQKPTPSDSQLSDLMQALLRYLDEAIDGIKKGAVFATNEESQGDGGEISDRFDTPTVRKSQPTRRSTRTSTTKTSRTTPSPYKDGNIKNYLRRMTNDRPPPKVEQPSSDDYKVDDTLFDDVVMQDGPAMPNVAETGLGLDMVAGRLEPTEPLEEQYHTPPDSPSKISTDSPGKHPKNISGSETEYGSNSTRPSLIPRTSGKKRSLPPPSKPEIPCKMSGDAFERRSSGANPMQSLGGVRYIGDPEFRNSRLEHQTSFGTLHKSFSTESFSSISSSGATKPLSAWTTPNASFLAETPATSFDSTTEPFELDHLREKPLQGRRSWQNLKAPFGSGFDMDVDKDMFGKRDIVPMGPPPSLARGRSIPEVSVQSLLSASPFSAANPAGHVAVHLRQLYEVCRVSTQTQVPLHAFAHRLNRRIDDYEGLWSDLTSTVEDHAGSMPEKCSSAAWRHCEQDFKGVALTGTLNFVEGPGDRIFEFKLNPLKIEPTYRLARKFGHDRFFLLDIPSIDPSDLPRHLRSDSHAREAILAWLGDSEHTFLGRKWRAFYIRNGSRKKPRPGSASRMIATKPCFRVYLFAESGSNSPFNTENGEKDPGLLHHSSMTRENLIEWFMPVRDNQKQRALKFFARLALGVSQTVPGRQFHPEQIIRSDDAFANAPAQRRLNAERSHEKKTKRRSIESKSAVMNDGCARISIAAADAVAHSLNLDRTPSIFQGRIAGAKGVWMVDTLDETLAGPDGEFWIEITDSQLKFEASGKDEYQPDPERVTFEVRSFARSLVQANLNFQLLPILADRGVPFEVFSHLLEADLTAKVAELEAAMGSGLAIRKWNQDVNTVLTTERAAYGVEMLGGLPDTLPEKINWFVEHGFEPKDCCRLKDLLYKAIADYCLRLEKRMNIGVARSTYAYMVADPLAVLEEDEVHIAFSTPFDHEFMLHDMDLLVARLPAALPSDVQKVRAVFKLELTKFRDVIVFPSKGDRPLAEKLSGGDYDGDRAWICWEPLLVEPFQNAPTILDAPPLSAYGIEVDQTTVSDLVRSEDYTSQFLHHAFDFTLQPNLLGICTSYFESFCYSQNTISHPSAVKIAYLLGYLVDRAKAGIIFDENKWYDFLRSEGLPKKLPKPAYKDTERTVQPKKTHLIDRLVFDTAKGVRQRVLHNFSRRFKEVGTYDSDLVALHKTEVEESKWDEGIAKALQDLKVELKDIKDFYSKHCSRANDADGYDVSPMKEGKGRKTIVPFQAVAEQVRDKFLAIRPSKEAGALSPIVARWSREAFSTDKMTNAPRASFSATTGDSFTSNPTAVPSSHASLHHWTLLKASTAFFLFHNTNFIWYACGVELGIIKAQAKGSRHVVNDVWAGLKVDKKAVRRTIGADEGGVGGRSGGGVGGGRGAMGGDAIDGAGWEREEDEYGDWGWVEGMDV